MPWKDPEEGREYHKKYIRKHYKKDKSYYIKKAKERKQKIKHWYIEYKKSIYCVDCNKNDFRVIDFDHINPKNKFLEVSQMIQRSFAVKRIIDEIKKCEPRCANCHRIKTWIERSA